MKKNCIAKSFKTNTLTPFFEVKWDATCQQLRAALEIDQHENRKSKAGVQRLKNSTEKKLTVYRKKCLDE